MKAVTLAGDLVGALQSRGLVPENCRRIIIDCEAGGVVKLMYEVYAEPAVLSAILDAKLEIKES